MCRKKKYFQLKKKSWWTWRNGGNNPWGRISLINKWLWKQNQEKQNPILCNCSGLQHCNNNSKIYVFILVIIDSQPQCHWHFGPDKFVVGGCSSHRLYPVDARDVLLPQRNNQKCFSQGSNLPPVKNHCSNLSVINHKEKVILVFLKSPEG